MHPIWKWCAIEARQDEALSPSLRPTRNGYWDAQLGIEGSRGQPRDPSIPLSGDPMTKQPEDVPFLPLPPSLWSFQTALLADASGPGPEIWESWRQEHAVPASVRDSFFQALEGVWNSPATNPVDCLRSCIDPSHQMARPIGHHQLPERVANVSNASSLIRATLGEGRLETILTEADAAELHQVARLSPDAAAKYLPTRLRARGKETDLVWWTDPGKLETGLEGAELVDRLGLAGAHYSPCNWLLAVSLPVEDAGNLAIPTVLDAAGNPRFRPQPPAASAGRTVAASSPNGLPEWVGRPPETTNATVEPRGHVT